MFKRTNLKKKKVKILDYLTPIILFVGIILGFFEGGIIGSLVTIPLWFIGIFASLLGLIPVAGPFIYYFLMNFIFNYISSPFGLCYASQVIFYYFLGVSIIYSVISTFALIVLIYLRRQLGRLRG